MARGWLLHLSFFSIPIQAALPWRMLSAASRSRRPARRRPTGGNPRSRWARTFCNCGPKWATVSTRAKRVSAQYRSSSSSSRSHSLLPEQSSGAARVAVDIPRKEFRNLWRSGFGLYRCFLRNLVPFLTVTVHPPCDLFLCLFLPSLLLAWLLCLLVFFWIFFLWHSFITQYTFLLRSIACYIHSIFCDY